MAKLYANQRVNLNASGQLCTDADPTSASLFATPGQEFEDTALPVEKFPNRDEYFDDGSDDAKVARHARKRTAATGSVHIANEANENRAPVPAVEHPKKGSSVHIVNESGEEVAPKKHR